MAEVLKEVSDDTHAAIINSYFPGTEDGQEFVILSTKEAHKRLGIPQHDRHRQLGEHQVTLNGKQYPAFLRLKENMRPSAWVLFDRDVDEHTPQAYAAMSFEEWIKTMAKFIPGFDTITYILAASTSSRVLLDGKPVGAGNGHLWMKVENSDDIERFRNAALLAAIKAGVVWTKNRMSRTTPGTVVGHSLATIVDISVLVAGRLVFVGMPVADANFVVAPQSLVIHQGTHDMLNTELVVLPDPTTVRALTRVAGIEMNIQMGKNGLSSTANDLTWDTEVETESFGTITVRTYIALGHDDQGSLPDAFPQHPAVSRLSSPSIRVAIHSSTTSAPTRRTAWSMTSSKISSLATTRSSRAKPHPPCRLTRLKSSRCSASQVTSRRLLAASRCCSAIWLYLVS